LSLTAVFGEVHVFKYMRQVFVTTLLVFYIHEVDRMTRCINMTIWNVPKCELDRLSIGRRCHLLLFATLEKQRTGSKKIT